MNAPVTTLDGRFSDPTAVATTWDATRHELDAAQLFWITTVRPDGRPNVTPLVAVWLDDALHFCTGSEEQKAVNLRGNQHVVLTTGCNTWEGGLDVTVRRRRGPANRPRRPRTAGERLARQVGRPLAVHRPGRSVSPFRQRRRQRSCSRSGPARSSCSAKGRSVRPGTCSPDESTWACRARGRSLARMVGSIPSQGSGPDGAP